MQLLLHNQQEYNRYYRRLWFMNLSRTLFFQSNSMQPHQQTTSQSHKSFFQFFLICNFFFFTEVLWGFILPPAVSLSRILWELALRCRKDPPLRIAKKSLIVSWWSWWESHPCLKSYWTTFSLSLLRESVRLYLVDVGFENLWENLYPTISVSHILILVTYKS